MSLPHFLRDRDPDYRSWRDWYRYAYESRGSDDRLPRHYLTMEDALEEANLLARKELPEGAEQ